MKNKSSTGEKLTLSLMTVTTIFYATFVYQKVWNWFMTSYFFTVGYWEMMLGMMIAKFIFSPKRSYNEIKEFNEKIDKLSFSEKLENKMFNLMMITFGFGLFFLVKLLIMYFS